MTFVSNLDNHGVLHSGGHAELGGYGEQWHVGLCGRWIVAKLGTMHTCRTTHQLSVGVHPQEYSNM